MNDDLHRRIHATQVHAAEQVVLADLRARGLADPSNGPTQAQIDAGADALRQRQMAGKTTRPWADLPNSDKRKWREHAEAVLRTPMVCGFQKAWLGPCEDAATEGARCAAHAHVKCASCGAPATHECDSTGQFVCGAPLCDECEHTIAEDGTNGGIGFFRTSPFPSGMKEHCKKAEQKFKPWYAREEMPGSISDSYQGPDDGVDPECRVLAQHFLQGEPCSDDPELMAKHTDSLSKAIQHAVKDWFLSPDEGE